MGDMDLAKTMVDAAQSAGADYAKFQYWRVANLKSGPWDTDGRREIYQQAQLDNEKLHQVKFYCQEANIKFLCSVFDQGDAKALAKVSNLAKIPSHEATNTSLIRECVDRFEHIYISLGATTSEEKHTFLSEYKSESDRITVFYCVSAYPMPLHAFKTQTLKEMMLLFGAAGYQVGYSGHHTTIYDAVIALSMGVDIVEKHFTTNNSLPGRDNQFALSPEEMESLCYIREEMSAGLPSPHYGYNKIEQEVRDVYRGRWSKRHH